MDLSRLPNDKKLQLCRWYYKVGWFLLPFVWVVNAIWFFKEAFMKPPYDEQKEIKKYVIMSAAGAVAWIAVFAVWITVFQLQRVSWGSTGDTLSFIVPLGRA
uniref:Gamma-secretase subunit PEN-2 n=1 Tax=Heliothis virescens TaxID=7102 RepID=A0A2A4K5L7_HELVI